MLHWAVMALAVLGCASGALAQGSGSTGGGKAVVCRDGAHKIVKASILDLYEAKDSPAIQLRMAAGSFDEEALLYATIFDELLAEISPDELASVTEVTTYIQDMFRFVDTSLPELDDTGPTPEMKAGCRLEQLAIYDEYVAVNQEIWDALDDQHRVALYAHETLYFEDRRNGATTSERSRQAVGLLFSTMPWQAKHLLRQIYDLK